MSKQVQTVATLADQLNSAVLSGNWRRAADVYLELYHLKSLDPAMQYWCISGFRSIFAEEQCVANESDIAFLTKISKDPGVPREQAAEAGFALGLVLWMQFRQEDSRKAYSRVLKLTMTPQDRARRIQDSTQQTTTAGVVFDTIVQLTRDNLQSVRDPALAATAPAPDPRRLNSKLVGISPTSGVTRQQGTRTITNDKLTADVMQKYMEMSQRVSGGACDYCHVVKGAGEGDVSKLFICGKCRRKTYCSPECQAADWKSGKPIPHKLNCRAKHVFKEGDIVMIQGHPTVPALNGQLVSIYRETAGAGTADVTYTVCLIGAESIRPTLTASMLASPVATSYIVSGKNLSLVAAVEERVDLS